MRVSIEEFVQLAGGEIIFGAGRSGFENITTDSNRIKGEDLFIPIRGERTDGHKYIASAFENGAAVSLTEEAEKIPELELYKEEKGLILVDSTIDALQRFSAAFREKYLKIPFIGVTGSVGKTTTREMIAAALRACCPVYTTKGNANSQVGVPITVFETDREAGFAVVELGISEPGEMKKISSVACVETAVMTNIGISHLAQFGSQENILREKIGILSGADRDCRLLVNGDDPILGNLKVSDLPELGVHTAGNIRIYRYGFSEDNDFRAENPVKEGPFCSFDFVSAKEKPVHVRLSVPGEHMAMNALAALAVCEIYGKDTETCARALEEFQGFEGRGNRIKVNGADVINDCYNASPVSMKSGLSVFEETETAGKKIAVLADMRELGSLEKEYHREIGEYICRNIRSMDLLYTYGDLAELIGEPVKRAGNCEVRHFTDLEQLKQKLWSECGEGDLLFLKGSQCMGLKKLIG